MSKYWIRVEKNIYRRKGSPYFWIQYSADGKRHRESTKTDKITDARRILKQREGEAMAGKAPALKHVKFEDMVDLIVKDYKINKKKSIGRLDNSIGHLKEYFGGVKAGKIRPSDIDDYVDMRLEEDAMNATINKELCALRRMGNLALEKELIDRFPKIRILKEVDKEGKPNTRTGFFEHPQFLDLRNALPDYMKPVVTLAYESGMRREEILGLKWDQVKLKQGTIVLEPGMTKNDEARIFYMSPKFREMLTELWEKRAQLEKDIPYVFVNRSGAGRIVDYRKAWKRALKKVGLAGKLFHDFRRTAVRNMVRAGVPESVAMKISGHKDRSIFERYNITDEKDLKEASKLMKTYLEDQEIDLPDAKLTHSARSKEE
jgi:integrase